MYAKIIIAYIMRKFIIIIVMLMLLLNIAVRMFRGEERTPQSVFKEQMDVAPMQYYSNPTYGYNIAYPCFFHEDESEDGDSCHARFIFTYNTNIIVETYVMKAPCRSTRDCALALTGNRDGNSAEALSGAGRPLSQLSDISKNSFILSGRVYENGQPTDGYRHYTKYIKSGHILFVYSLIYPEDYKQALGRMFRTIDKWTVTGALVD